LQHQWVFLLADLPSIIILDFLDIFLGLDPLVFGEGAMVTLLQIMSVSMHHHEPLLGDLTVTDSPSVSEKVRSHGLDISLGGRRELANTLEIFLAGPALWQDGQR